MDKIKILNIISDSNIGGAGKCVITFCNNFDKDKFDVSVLLPRGSLLKNELIESGVRIIEIDGMRDKSFDLISIPKISKVIKEESPDIVHTHASFTARIAARKFDEVKIVYTKHCDFPISSKFKYKIVRYLYKKINESLTDRIIATSENAKLNLIKQGISEDIIDVVLNGVDGFNELPFEEKNRIREKYGLSSEDIIIGYLARVEELKGHKFLIEAMKLLKDRNYDKNIKLLIMGSGSYENGAKELVESYELEDRIIFTGFIKDVSKMLNIVDLQVNASYLSETTNLSLLEGMSLGIPTLATSVGGTTQMIENYENGILVEKGSAEALASGIVEILSDKEKFNCMKEKSKKVFTERYTSNVYTKNIEKIYESLVK